MSADLAIYNAGQLITADPSKGSHEGPEKELGIIDDGAFLIKESRFVWVGSTSEFKNKGFKAIINVDAEGFLVTPGFIDPHTHLIFSGSREDELDRKVRGESYMEILKSGGGIARTVGSTRSATEEELIQSAVSRIKQLVSSGVTTVEVKTGYCLDLAGELKMLSAISKLPALSHIDIISTFLGLHALPPEFKDAKEYVNHIAGKVLPAISKSDFKPIFSDCFCEADLFDSVICEKYLTASSKLGFKLKIHADEFSNAGGAELAAKMGCTSADHLERSSGQGLRLMASKGVTAVLLPATAFYSRIDQPDFSLIKKSGCTFALGTDLSPNSWVESPQLVMAIACLEMGMTAAEALLAFTRGAAKALSLNDRGIISEGKLADFAIHEHTNYKFLPYRVGGRYIRSVFKKGRKVYPQRVGRYS